MTTVSLKEALTRMAELLKLLDAGETVVITQDDHAIARLMPAERAKPKPRVPGVLKGTVLYMAEDFDDPLPEFEEYMS